MSIPSPAVLALSDRGQANFHAVVNFRFTAFSEVELPLYGVLRISDQHKGESGLFLEVTAFIDSAPTSRGGRSELWSFRKSTPQVSSSSSRFDGSRGSEHPAGLLFSPHG
jgi:hypothetical protein